MESISSGVNFLRRRFSSQDIEDDDKSMSVSSVGGRGSQQQQTHHQHHFSNTLSQAQNGPPDSFSFAGLANKVSSAIRSVFKLYTWNLILMTRMINNSYEEG